MARFWGQVSGRARSDASRLGDSQVRVKANAWSIGGVVSAYETGAERTPAGRYAVRGGKKQEGEDVVSPGVTGGSNGGRTMLLDLGTWKRDPDGAGVLPVDEAARHIFAALCPESAREIGRRFMQQRDREDARRELGLPDEAKS